MRRPGAALLAFGGDIDGVLDPDSAVAAAGQATEGEHSIGAESVDELTGDAEEVGGLGGGDFVLGAEHHDAGAVGHVVEYRAHGDLDRRVATGRSARILASDRTPGSPGFKVASGWVVMPSMVRLSAITATAQLGSLYVRLVEDQLRRPRHQATVGRLLCTDKNDRFVQYVLATNSQLIAVASYDLLPAAERAALPSEADLGRALDS